MRKIIILFLSLISICSCHSQRTIEKQETYKRVPVGHELLLNAKEYNTLKYLSENLNSYYYGLSQDSLSESPVIKEIEYVKIGDKDDRYCYCEDNNVLMNSFNYRLPDIHGFQVYYSTKQGCDARYTWNMDEICGNLILVDTISGQAKLINVFLVGYGDQHIAYRYFTIDENYNITIFNAAAYEEGFSMAKKYLITINSEQEINIFEHNCLNQRNVYDSFSSSDEIPDILIKKDSCQYYRDLYEKLVHRFPYPALNYLSPIEVELVVEDSVAYWAKYVEVGNQRAMNDSIKYLNKIERLQNVVHPVDSTLPFGPKSLEYLVETNQNKIKFTIFKDQDLTDEEELKNRKLIYDAWMYYLAFHPREFPYSEDRIHLKLKTRQYINLSDEENIEEDNFKEDINIGHIAVRISNIQGFEVYYSTTGVDSHDNECGVDGWDKTEENCCYTRGFGCDSKGYLIFYERKKQHGTIIPVYETYSDRFFYISKDNTIHIFEGETTKYYINHSFYEQEWTKSVVTLSKSHEIKVKKNKEFIINKIVQND